MSKFPDNCIDLVLTDPPYGINYQSTRRTDKNKWKPKIKNDEVPFVCWIKPIKRILKDSGRILSFCRWDVESIFQNEFNLCGYNIKSQVIWDKIVHGMGDLSGEFAPQHENIIYATKGRYEFTGKRPHTILRHQRVSPENLSHPNEKPISLLIELIKTISNPNDIILDPFCGAGTTCVAAKKLHRNYIGIDISEEYCKLSERRLKQVKPDLFEKKSKPKIKKDKLI